MRPGRSQSKVVIGTRTSGQVVGQRLGVQAGDGLPPHVRFGRRRNSANSDSRPNGPSSPSRSSKPSSSSTSSGSSPATMRPGPSPLGTAGGASPRATPAVSCRSASVTWHRASHALKPAIGEVLGAARRRRAARPDVGRACRLQGGRAPGPERRPGRQRLELVRLASCRRRPARPRSGLPPPAQVPQLGLRRSKTSQASA